MAKNFLINGDTKNTLSPFDRGLAFGDGAFRTFLVKDGNPINWKNQYQKLSIDLKAIDIKSPSKKTLSAQKIKTPAIKPDFRSTGEKNIKED